MPEQSMEDFLKISKKVQGPEALGETKEGEKKEGWTGPEGQKTEDLKKKKEQDPNNLP